MCIEYHIQVNMYHVSAQGVDERMINDDDDDDDDDDDILRRRGVDADVAG